ncbi:MAG: 4Fe-4S binding protein [Lachnospiraceae bacterium]|nr:4Fe-4S binding protein [Lachnospiraceae bacterium]MCI9183796.1 4Fe-4S binding protein [Lachnospiraceae bacterium]
MFRKIIEIDEKECNGCGACAKACHEGAIVMVDGKAKLIRDDYCDGLGDCLPTCPTGAISFVEREAAAYDQQAVMQNKQKPDSKTAQPSGGLGFAGKTIGAPGGKTPQEASLPVLQSRLSQWPVQIKLAPVNAPYFQGAKMLVAASCTAYAYGNFHEEFMKNHITLIGCPKLDGVDYSEKLTKVIQSNEIKSVAIVRMEVPCCGGLEIAVKTALKNSGKSIPCQVATVSTSGGLLD